MKAFITGVTGQDGYYLSNYYFKKGMKYMAQLEGTHQLTLPELIL